jgi:membrane protease YdiL (CAAX protease family)
MPDNLVQPRPLWQRYIAIVVYLIGAMILIQVLAAILLYFFPLPGFPGKISAIPFRFLIFSLVAQMVGFLLPAPLLIAFSRGRQFSFEKVRAREILLACGLVFLCTLSFSSIYHLLGIEPKQLGFLDGDDVLANKGAFVALTAILAPAYEEWIFRGLLFGILVTNEMRIRRVVAAAIFCAFLFTVIHIEGAHSLSSLPPIFVMALILQYVTWRTGSLWPAVCGHAMQNLMAAGAFIAKYSAEISK